MIRLRDKRLIGQKVTVNAAGPWMGHVGVIRGFRGNQLTKSRERVPFVSVQVQGGIFPFSGEHLTIIKEESE